MRYLQKTEKTKKVKLDVKDKKIFSILSFNARIPLTQLAKKVALSRDAVNYRIKNYEKKGVIQGYRTMIDISKFGYNNYHLFIKLNNPSQEVEKRILNKLIKYPFIRAIIKFSGNFDFEIALIAKDLKELDKIIEKIMDDCSNFLQDYDILIFRKLYVTRALPKSFSEYIKDTSVGNKKYKIDKKDITILKLISENSLLPLYEIASKAGLSADAVAYRIKNMKDSGIINKFVPIINYNSLDYNVYTVLFNISTLNEENEKKLREFLINDKNVMWAIKTIGKFNILVYFLVKNIDDLQNSVLKFRSLFPKQINRHETLIAYEEHKFTYFPSGLF